MQIEGALSNGRVSVRSIIDVCCATAMEAMRRYSCGVPSAASGSSTRSVALAFSRSVNP